ncbi:TPA: hypothetical protein QFK59_000864, partial [Enterococcus faecium]
LKRKPHSDKSKSSFGSIQISIALKLTSIRYTRFNCFGSIQISIALKLYTVSVKVCDSFGSIQISIALKPRRKNFSVNVS